MNIRHKIVELLQDALADPTNRGTLIGAFQEIVWNELGSNSFDRSLTEKLRELAHDLDFYEPDAELRRESDVYFDDARAVELIKPVLIRLERDEYFKIM